MFAFLAVTLPQPQTRGHARLACAASSAASRLQNDCKSKAAAVLDHWLLQVSSRLVRALMCSKLQRKLSPQAFRTQPFMVVMKGLFSLHLAYRPTIFHKLLL